MNTPATIGWLLLAVWTATGLFFAAAIVVETVRTRRAWMTHTADGLADVDRPVGYVPAWPEDVEASIGEALDVAADDWQQWQAENGWASA